MSNKISFTFVAVDQYTAVAKKISDATASVRDNMKTLGGVMSGMRHEIMSNIDGMVKAGRNLKQFGRDVSLYVSVPAAGMIYASIRSFDAQASALAQVETAIKSTAGVAKLSMDELIAEATRLQNETIFGDETILQDATAQLLTFTNIAGNEFKRTQVAALDLASRLKIDLKSASIQLGKALNEPVQNLSALSRSGIQFSKEQKELINALWSVGMKAEAQRVILKELERQYGGSARAAAQAGLGPFKQMMNVFDDLRESIGKALLEVLNPFITDLKDMFLWMQTLSPATMKVVAVVLLLLTGLGPLIIALGVIMQMLPLLILGTQALGAAFALLTGPMGKITLAFTLGYQAGSILYEKFESIQMIAINVIETIVGAYDKIMGIHDALVGIASSGIEKFMNFTGLGEKLGIETMNRADINVNLRAPQGAVESVKTRSSNSTSMNVGVNMAPT